MSPSNMLDRLPPKIGQPLALAFGALIAAAMVVIMITIPIPALSHTRMMVGCLVMSAVCLFGALAAFFKITRKPE